MGAKKYALGPNAARRVSELIRGSGSVGRRQVLSPAAVFDTEFVFPFTVQWAASADTDGAWLIWLPSGCIVSVEGETLDPRTALTAAGGDYPAGWFILDDSLLDRDTGGTLYLHITRGEDAECSFSSSSTPEEDSTSSGSSGGSSSGSSDDDEEDNTIVIAICEAEVDSTAGTRSVTQFVTSSIVIANGEQVDGVSKTLTVVCEVKYSSSTHQLTAKTALLTFERGILTECTESDTDTVITTAVEETV